MRKRMGNDSSNSRDFRDNTPKEQQTQISKLRARQDMVQQLINDSTGRLLAELEAVFGLYFKTGFQSRYDRFRGVPSDILKHLYGVKMGVNALVIQSLDGSKDPSLPPLKYGNIEQNVLQYYWDYSTKIPDNEVRDFLQKVLIGLDQQNLPHDLEIPKGMSPPFEQIDHRTPVGQHKMVNAAAGAHIIAEETQKRLKPSLPDGSERYDVKGPQLDYQTATGLMNQFQEDTCEKNQKDTSSTKRGDCNHHCTWKIIYG